MGSGADLGQGLAESWAELCGIWALTADKLRRLSEAERAIQVQCRLLHDCGSKDLEMEALKALAVVRRQQRNDAGVDEALANVEELAPDEEKEKLVKHVRRRLRDVAPEVTAAEREQEQQEREAAAAAEAHRTAQSSGLLQRLQERPVMVGIAFLAALALIFFFTAVLFGTPAGFPFSSQSPTPTPAQGQCLSTEDCDS